MSCALVRLSVFASAILLLSGCGGTSGNSGDGGGAGNPPTTVTVTFTGAMPTAVATQIGSGAYTAVTPSSSITLTLLSGTTDFAVAYVCPPVAASMASTVTEERVQEASALDGSSLVGSCPVAIPVTVATGTLTGTVDASAIPGVDSIEIYAGNALSGQALGPAPVLPQGSSSAFNSLVPAGTDRVVVLAYDTIPNGNFETLNLLAAKNFSSQTVPGALNSGNTVVMGAADQTIPESISYVNAPPGFTAPASIVGYFPGGSNWGITLAGNATSQYPAMPAAVAQLGDQYNVLTRADSTSSGGGSMEVFTQFQSAGPISITLPAPWVYSGPTPAALPTINFAYSGSSSMGGASKSASIGWTTSSGTSYSYEVSASESYQNGATSLPFPNLSGINGFIPVPLSGTMIDWGARIVQKPSGGPVASSPSVQTSLVNSGSYTVP